MFKIVLTIAAAVLATIFVAKLTFDANSYTGSEPSNQPWAQETMKFVSWNDERWTAWIRSGKFEQSPQDTDKWSRHANASIAYTDWEGGMWQAKIEGFHPMRDGQGTFNLGCREGVSKADFAFYLADELGLPVDSMTRAVSSKARLDAVRPHDMRMECSRSVCLGL